MTKTTNPFAFGSPVKGDQFGDRVAETSFLVRRMTTGQNVLVTSPRRYGKTSVILHAVEQVRQEERGRVGVASLLRCANRRDVAEEVTRAVLDGALGWMVGTAEQIAERLHRLPRVTPSIERDGWRFGLDARGEPDDFLQDIRRPIELLADSARDGHPVSLVLDEFQQVAEIDRHLGGFFKTVTDDLPDVSLVFAGSHRHMMERLFVGPGAALKNAAEPISLEIIPEPLIVTFLCTRMQSVQRELREPAAQLIYRLMRGIPHFVQLLAAATYDQETTPVDEMTVRIALVEVLARQRADLAVRYENLATNQRKLALGLASKGPVRDLLSRATLTSFGLSLSSAVRARDALRDTEIIEFDSSLGWRVSDPIFERWLHHGLGLDLGATIDPTTIE